MAEPDPYAEAERLMRAAQEAAARAAAAAEEVPPRGWAVAGDGAGRDGNGDGGGAPAFPDLSSLLALVEALRGTVPPELLAQVTDAVRDLLIALRTVLDYSIARLERPAQEPVRVEDIPIE
jgi:hypothetical protein